VKLRLNVKSRSKVQETLHDLEKAATYLRNTSLYLQRIANFLEETSYVDTNNILSDTPDSPSSMHSAPDVAPELQMSSERTAEDVEAALILTNMRAGNIYTSTEFEAAVTLTMMQKGSSAGTEAIQDKSDSASLESSPSDRSMSGRVVRSRPMRVNKAVGLGATIGLMGLIE